jgi:hypothetical protein
MASCRTSKQLRRIGDRNDRGRPAYPKDLRASVACLTPAFPAFGNARRSAVMTNLTLIYAMLS